MSEAARRSDALSAKRRANLADWAVRQGAKQPRLDTLFRPPAPVAVAAPVAEQVPSTAQQEPAAAGGGWSGFGGGHGCHVGPRVSYRTLT